MSEEDIRRMQVLWGKGQNMFLSFFTELANVQREMKDNKAFSAWCLNDLGISLATIHNVADVLKKVDAQRVKRDLASARAAEQIRRETERALQRIRKAEQKAAKEKARLEEKERKLQEVKDVKEQERRIRKRQRDAEYRRRKRERRQSVDTTAAQPAHNLRV